MRGAVVPVRGGVESASCEVCSEEIHRFASKCVHCGARRRPGPIGPLEFDRSIVRMRWRAALVSTLSIVGFLTFLPILAIPGLALAMADLEPGWEDARFPARRVYAFVAVVFGALHLLTIGVAISIAWLRWGV